MSDLQNRILDVVHKPQLAALATLSEDGAPWVRYVVTVGGGNLELRCATFKKSRKVNQIARNPKVHVTCGVSSLQEMAPYLQIEGTARVASNSDEKANFWNDMLEPIFSGPDDPDYVVVVIQPTRIEYCTPGSYEPEVWIR